VVGGCRLTSGVQEIGFVGPISYATRAISGFGAALKQSVRESFGRALTVGALGDFLPNDATRVTIDPAERDANGVPLPRIHSHLTAQDIARLRFMAEQCRRVLREAGVKELVEEYGTYDFFSSTHVAGTCRMGADAGASVVDAFGKTHECPNLFIADGSVMPSLGGGEGPSLSISALAIRTADRIAGATMLPRSTARS
jgi:choline dehydrogenase-like flavoprotein